MFILHFTFVLGGSAVAVAYSFDDSDEEESVMVRPDPPSDLRDQQPSDPDPPSDSRAQQPAPDPTSGDQPALFQLVAHAPPKPAPSVAAMPTPQARPSARLSMFKPTVDTEENKESRTNKSWVGRR